MPFNLAEKHAHTKEINWFTSSKMENSKKRKWACRHLRRVSVTAELTDVWKCCLLRCAPVRQLHWLKVDHCHMVPTPQRASHTTCAQYLPTVFLLINYLAWILSLKMWDRAIIQFGFLPYEVSSRIPLSWKRFLPGWAWRPLHRVLRGRTGMWSLKVMLLLRPAQKR